MPSSRLLNNEIVLAWVKFLNGGNTPEIRLECRARIFNDAGKFADSVPERLLCCRVSTLSDVDWQNDGLDPSRLLFSNATVRSAVSLEKSEAMVPVR